MPFDIRRRRQQMEMDPRFQRATYARQMTDPRQLAVPGVSDVVRGYAGRQAEVEEYGASRAGQIGMREKEAALTEKTRAAQITASRRDLGYQRDVQKAMEEENRMATSLAVADVGLNVMGGYADIREGKRQEKFMGEQQQYFRDMSTLLEDLIIKRISALKGTETMFRGEPRGF